MQHHNMSQAGHDRRQFPAVIVGLIVAMLVLAGCGTSMPTPTEAPPATVVSPATVAAQVTAAPQSTIAPNATTIAPAAATATRAPTTTRPLLDHIYLIVMENKEESSIIGSNDAPYLNSLIRQYGMAKNYTGVAHPSQPNYLALWAGSTFNVTDDSSHNLTGETLGDQIEAANMSWRVYAENYPVSTPCYTDSSANGGPDGSGSYARKHNPAISFTNVNSDSTRCSQHITNFSHFDPGAASFSFIVPNLCHDMHDCPVKQGDTWLQQWLPQHILNTSTWKNSNSAIFITWDEGTSANGGGGTVPLIVISHKTPAGFVSTRAYNHYSLLRTIEDAWGLYCLRDACQAPGMTEFFP